jgi:hypothetical protein
MVKWNSEKFEPDEVWNPSKLLFEYDLERIIDKICKATLKDYNSQVSVDYLIKEVSAELKKRPFKN